MLSATFCIFYQANLTRVMSILIGLAQKYIYIAYFYTEIGLKVTKEVA